MHFLEQFFTDKDGNVVLGQKPNAPLMLWVLTLVASILTSGSLSSGTHTLSSMFLFVWAYLELTAGVTSFRRMLGGIVALYLIIAVTI